ncbi:hypothetical protein [Pseudoduganella sp. R-34]|uniref:hypothetical protein n=1 Tax=Pseudoduganella sp. R-34 TaxID=3404062 RepID=UPI003CF708FA
MDTNDSKFEEAMRALCLALPEGKHMQAIAFRAQVGFTDTGAGTVYALVIAESAEDLARAGQIINNGIEASQAKAGLVEHFVRNTAATAGGVSPNLDEVCKPSDSGDVNLTY